MSLQKPPYCEQLLRIRELLEEILQGFPKGHCAQASYVVEQVVPGLKQVGGRFIPQNYYDSWNLDPERGLYVHAALDPALEPSVRATSHPIIELEGKVWILPADNDLFKITRKDTADVLEYSSKCIVNDPIILGILDLLDK